MSRYAEALESVVRRISTERRGWFLVQVAPGEQSEVAAYLGELLTLPVAALGDEIEGYSECVVRTGVGMAVAERDASLSSLNSRRDRLSDRGRWIFVVSRVELHALQHFAPDIFSVLRAAEEVPLIPRELDATESEAARLELAAWYRARLGRLDLRGFIRSEREDVSFAIEDIFEPLCGYVSRASRSELEQEEEDWREIWIYRDERKPLIEILGKGERVTLIIGGPGAGKSFFLRWLALQSSSALARGGTFLGVSRPFPVLISLAAMSLVSNRLMLLEHAAEALLADGLAAGHLLAKEAIGGHALFLLDGLDEVAVSFAPALPSLVEDLLLRFPQSRVVLTSRPSRTVIPLKRAEIVTIAPLDDESIKALLVRWCELYEWQRAETAMARERGRGLGAALAKQVLGSWQLRDLATSPLLLTIVAIVHRAGVRLPDRRVELYEQVLKVLVERWNSLRSEVSQVTAPLKLVDAIRLLGPVAVEMIERDLEGAVDERSLETMLHRALEVGNVPSLSDPRAALELFRNNLGLLVERTPGVYGFLHKTFVEFLAAHELIRTNRFVALSKAPARAFTGKWQQVILLGAGILGVLQANDEELAKLVKGLVSAARQRKTSFMIPSLLAELLADDPCLTQAMAEQLANELIPKWWFGNPYEEDEALLVLENAQADLMRISQNRWHPLLRQKIQSAYSDDEFPDTGSWEGQSLLIGILDQLGVDVGSLVCESYLDYGGPYLFSPVHSIATLREQPYLRRGMVDLRPNMGLLLMLTVDSGAWAVDHVNNTILSVSFDGEAAEIIYKELVRERDDHERMLMLKPESPDEGQEAVQLKFLAAYEKLLDQSISSEPQ